MSETLPQGGRGGKVCLRWQKIGNSIPAVAGGYVRGTVTLIGDRVFYASGHGRLSVLSLKTQKWKTLGNILEGIGGGHAAQLAKDKIYYFGQGIEGVLEFDLVLQNTNLTQGKTEAPGGYLWMSAVFAPWREEIIAFGGYDQLYARTNTIQALNVESKQWTALQPRGPLPPPRTAHAAAIHGTEMYIYGGYSNTGSTLGDLWIAELANHVIPKWSQVMIKDGSPTSFQMPTLKYFRKCFILFGGTGEHAGDLNIHFPRENSFYDQYSSRLKVNGTHPLVSTDHLALTLSTGILYFTDYAILLLSPE